MEDKTADREVNVATIKNNGYTLVMTDEREVGPDASLLVEESCVEDGGLFLEIERGQNELGNCLWLTPAQVRVLIDFIADKGLGL